MTAADVIGRSAGKIVTVEFVKRTDGTVRKMNCRLGVKSKLRGGEQKYDPASKGLAVVFDMQAGEYRSIPLDSVLSVTSEGERIQLKAA
jgi:hypothetical protein